MIMMTFSFPERLAKMTFISSYLPAHDTNMRYRLKRPEYGLTEALDLRLPPFSLTKEGVAGVSEKDARKGLEKMV